MRLMTNKEIAISYNNALYKYKQIGILAQLNDITQKEVKEILESEGVDINTKNTRSNGIDWTYKKTVLIGLYERNTPISEMTRILNISKDSIYNKLKELKARGEIQ